MPFVRCHQKAEKGKKRDMYACLSRGVRDDDGGVSSRHTKLELYYRCDSFSSLSLVASFQITQYILKQKIINNMAPMCQRKGNNKKK